MTGNPGCDVDDVDDGHVIGVAWHDTAAMHPGILAGSGGSGRASQPFEETTR